MPPGAQPKTPNERSLTLLFAAIANSARPACFLLSWVKVIKRKARAVPCLFVIGRRLLPCPQAKRQHGLRAPQGFHAQHFIRQDFIAKQFHSLHILSFHCIIPRCSLSIRGALLALLALLDHLDILRIFNMH